MKNKLQGSYFRKVAFRKLRFFGLMKNKRAWIRIAEASIAVLIVISAMLIIMARQPIKANLSEDIYEKQKQIMDIVVENNTLRQEILNGNLGNVNQQITSLKPGNWEFAINICDLDQVCPNPQPIYDKDVYTIERIVASTLTEYNPKKIRFFVWMK